MSESERRALARIQASLARIERGTCGACVICGELIDEDRLRAIPRDGSLRRVRRAARR